MIVAVFDEKSKHNWEKIKSISSIALMIIKNYCRSSDKKL